jgi:hypothetical protein
MCLSQRDVRNDVAKLQRGSLSRDALYASAIVGQGRPDKGQTFDAGPLTASARSSSFNVAGCAHSPIHPVIQEIGHGGARIIHRRF